MVQYAERHLEGNTLVVRIPMRFHRRGGRKRIVTPDGIAIVPPSKPSPTARWLRRSCGVALAAQARRGRRHVLI